MREAQSTQRIEALEARIDALRQRPARAIAAPAAGRRHQPRAARRTARHRPARGVDRGQRVASSPTPSATARRRCAWTNSKSCSAWSSNACNWPAISTARAMATRWRRACSTASTTRPISACARPWRRNAARSMRSATIRARSPPVACRRSRHRCRHCRSARAATGDATAAVVATRVLAHRRGAPRRHRDRGRTRRPRRRTRGAATRTHPRAGGRRTPRSRRLPQRAGARRCLDHAAVAGLAATCAAQRARLRALRELPLAIALPTLGTTLEQLRGMRAAH